MRLALLAALLLPTQARAFDGARGASSPLFIHKGPPASPRPPSRAEALERLNAARSRFGHDAQAALTPARAPGEAFTVAVVGDGEPGRFFFERIFPPPRDAYEDLLQIMAAQRPDFVVQLGDFVSRGTPRNYLSYLGLLERAATVPLFHVIGNHDRRQTGKNPADKTFYKTLVGEATDRVIDRGGWRFIFLDDSDSRLTEAQLDWLDTALDTEMPSLIFMHIPPSYLYKRLDGKGNEQDFAEDEKPKTGYFNQGAERFREIVSRRKVRRVYMGHIHAFGAAQDRGVCYVLTGAGGSPTYPAKKHAALFKTHFLRLTLSGDSLSEEMHLLDGGSAPLASSCPEI